MTFTEDAWAQTAAIRGAIDELPFLRLLESGDLPREQFVSYLAQDAHYLAAYGRALALAASQATTSDELVFWAEAARTTVVVERELHAGHVAALDAVPPSPTCVAYTSYLLGLATSGSYATLVAGVLPCFWIYEDVGRRLKERVGAALDAHPYADWLGAYGDPDFAESARAARRIVDAVAAQADPRTITRMHEAFATAARYEWMFWDAPTRLDTWPV